MLDGQIKSGTSNIAANYLPSISNTVDSGKLELSLDQKNSLSYRDFELLRNGLKTMKITGLLS